MLGLYGGMSVGWWICMTQMTLCLSAGADTGGGAQGAQAPKNSQEDTLASLLGAPWPQSAPFPEKKLFFNNNKYIRVYMKLYIYDI